MALNYRLVKRKVTDLKGGAAKEKMFAIPSYNGYTDMKTLCKLIGARSTVSGADVKAVLDNLNFFLDLELQAGRIVQLGEFGNFRLSLSSSGADTKDTFKPGQLRKARVIFTPGKELRLTSSTVDMASAEKTTETGGETGNPDDKPDSI